MTEHLSKNTRILHQK